MRISTILKFIFLKLFWRLLLLLVALNIISFRFGFLQPWAICLLIGCIVMRGIMCFKKILGISRENSNTKVIRNELWDDIDNDLEKNRKRIIINTKKNRGIIGYLRIAKENHNRKIKSRKTLYGLFIPYFTIIFSILLFHYKFTDLLSIDWLFIPFILNGLLFIIFRIDARYFMLPALLLLWLCPFLLVYGLEKIAETIVIYIFYFIVMGMISKFIEFKSNYDLQVGFESIKGVLFRSNILYFSIFWAVFFVCCYFLDASDKLKAISLYLSITLFMIYIYRHLLDLKLDGEYA